MAGLRTVRRAANFNFDSLAVLDMCHAYGTAGNDALAAAAARASVRIAY